MNLKPTYGLLLLLLFIVIPLFAHLGEIPIQQWDEGRLAMKAIEMTESHNWLLTTVNGHPDFYSVKPPLLTWIQAIFIKVIGANELAIRLPSALAAVGICVLIYWFFAWKYMKDTWLGITANLTLISCMGFITLHGTRSGDYDTLLTLFTTGYVLFFFLYLEEGRVKYLHLTMACLLVSAYTKGIQGLLFLPAMFIYALATKKLLMVLKEKWFYIESVVFTALVLGYYLAREHYDHGYIDAVMLNELGGRYGQVIEGHSGSFFYFLGWIDERAFTYWWPMLVGGLIATFLSPDKQLRRIMFYLSLVSAMYMFIISSAATKCWWYIMPLMPFMAIMAGVFINIIFKALDAENVRPKLKYNILPLAFLIAVAYPPYKAILNITLDWQPGNLWDYVNGDISKVLYNVANENDKSLDGYLVLGAYEDNVTWYRDVIKRQHKPVQFTAEDDPGTATKVIAFRQRTKDYLDSNYNVVFTSSCNSVYYLTIKGKKTQLPAMAATAKVN